MPTPSFRSKVAWYQTYRAVAAARDDVLPQGEAEARFVEQMLGNEPIRIVKPAPVRRITNPGLVATVLANPGLIPPLVAL